MPAHRSVAVVDASEGSARSPCVHTGPRSCRPKSRVHADLADLPPALIATAEYDLLRDDGEQYAARLTAAGVLATAVRWPGHMHGSLGLTRLAPSAAHWHERQHAFLRERHGLLQAGDDR
jgi:acetyl esterase/lipase